MSSNFRKISLKIGCSRQRMDPISRFSITDRERVMLRFGCLVLFAGTAVCLSACGKSEEPKAEVKNNPQEVQVAPRQPPKAAHPAAPRKAEVRPSTEKSTQPQEDENAIDPATDPRDIFWAAGNALEFDIAGQEPAVREDDLYSVVLPPAGDFVRYDPVVPRREDAAAPAKKVTLPAGFSAIAAEGFAESGWPRRIQCGKDRSVMALVPAGTSPIGKEGGSAEAAPQLSVYLDDYYIDTTEVTLEQY
jgi:formylglycine-generating enzyme required for sulfatase activity